MTGGYETSLLHLLSWSSLILTLTPETAARTKRKKDTKENTHKSKNINSSTNS